MLYLETVSPSLLKIIQTISDEPQFVDFRLVGGTALSLQLGHRLSVDADFFSNHDFNQTEAQQKLAELLPGFSVMKESKHGFAGVFEDVKIDLYTWGVPFQKPSLMSERMRLADMEDIAALKLEAIVNRKEEKDFRDVHALLSVFSLAQMLDFFKQRITHRDLRLVIDHLAAAPAAERSDSIVLLKSIPYETVASDILQAIQQHFDFLRTEHARLAEQRLQQRLENLKTKDKI